MDDLKYIIEQHKLWMFDQKMGQRADLSGMDLSGADLSGVDLRGADLDYSVCKHCGKTQEDHCVFEKQRGPKKCVCDPYKYAYELLMESAGDNMDKKELFNLPIHRFRDPEGNPTCAISFEEVGNVCLFYMTGMCGQRETCFYATINSQGKQSLLHRRGEDELGYLIPHKDCPLWKQK